ncbi:hypothetical protein MMC25_004170 [Agyrium rufum]|nr:hypothetical protein [Agyrium rufum]
MAAFSSGHEMLASVSFDNTIRLWDVSINNGSPELQKDPEFVEAVTFSRNGRILGSLSSDGIIKLWNIGTRLLFRTLKTTQHPYPVLALTWKGEILVSTGSKGNCLWDTRTGAMLHSWTTGLQEIDAMAFSPNGKLLAMASKDEITEIVDVESGAAHMTLRSHEERVSTLAFLADGTLLASATIEWKFKLWIVGTGELLQILALDASLYWVLRTGYRELGPLECSDDGISLVVNGELLHINSFPNDAHSSKSTPGKRIFYKDEWIYYGSRRVLCLPPDYRSAKIAINGNTIGFGRQNGMVSFLKIDLEAC